MADYRKMAREAARRHGLDPKIFERQIARESGFRPRIGSPAGAQGIAQIMPATAKAWGVDPNNPEQALNAAAKHMSAYVKKYGSYEKALRAYNAGEGAIEKSKGYKETNDYVAAILGGREPAASASSSSSTLRGRVSASVRPIGSSEVDRRRIMRQTIAQGILSGQGLLASVMQAQEATSKALELAPPSQDAPRSTGAAARPKTGTQGSPTAIKELFYDPLGGWDNGKSIGAIGGHSDHVHVAADKARKNFLKGKARQLGLTITSEHGGKHTEGSLHYSDQAFDAAGSPEQMKAFAELVRRKYKLR